LNTGAYSSEIFRSAFETINKGILEAAEGLGINKINIFFKIKLPIAIKQSLPAYGNEMILMLKGTSLASTVTLLDLTGVAKHIISTTFRPVEVFIVAGSIYLLMTFVIHNFIKILEKKMYQHARDLEFEEAAKIRDEIRKLEATELEIVLNPKVKQYSLNNKIYPKGRSTMGMPGTRAQKGKKKWKQIK